MIALVLRSFLVAVLAAPLFAAVEARGADTVRIGVDWTLNPDHGPVVVALQRGYFSDAGLDVEIVTPTDTTENVTMVLDGRVDIGMSDQPRTQVEVAGGSPLAIVGTLIPVPLNVVLAIEGGPVRSVADLRGKRIGYADSAQIERDLLRVALAANGIDIDAVTLVDVGFDMVDALLAGRVDALTDTYRNFEPIRLELAGRKPLLLDIEGAAIPAYSELVYIVNHRRANGEVIDRFLAAVERAARSIAADPASAWTDFVAYDPKLNTELNRRSWTATVPFFALRPATLDRARYDAFAAFLLKNRMIDRVIPAGDYLYRQ